MPVDRRNSAVRGGGRGNCVFSSHRSRNECDRPKARRVGPYNEALFSVSGLNLNVSHHPRGRQLRHGNIDRADEAFNFVVVEFIPRSRTSI